MHAYRYITYGSAQFLFHKKCIQAFDTTHPMCDLCVDHVCVCTFRAVASHGAGGAAAPPVILPNYFISLINRRAIDCNVYI